MVSDISHSIWIQQKWYWVAVLFTDTNEHGENENNYQWQVNGAVKTSFFLPSVFTVINSRRLCNFYLGWSNIFVVVDRAWQSLREAGPGTLRAAAAPGDAPHADLTHDKVLHFFLFFIRILHHLRKISLNFDAESSSSVNNEEHVICVSRK